MADQHAARCSGPYGHSVVRTPAMDRLAAEGVTFDAAYTPSPICVPARMSFVTGREVQAIGVWDNGVPLREDAATVAHRLRAAGYRVALSGKMHFRGHDQLHGFERQLAADINALNAPDPPDWSKPLAPPPRLRTDMRRGPGLTAEIEADERAAEAAIAYLRHPERADAPWALVVGFVAPHPPLVAPERFYDLYKDAEIDLPSGLPPENEHPFARRYREARGLDLAPEVVRDVRRSYYALTTFLDERIGRIVAALEETGRLEETVVAYTADHGEMLGERGLWQKCCFYEPSVRIPLILRWPRRFRAGARVALPVSLLDLTATLVDLAGAPSAPALDGKSLVSLASGGTESRSAVFSEFYGNYSSAPMAMLRGPRYKLVYYHGEEPELFDLENDPGETRNLAASLPRVRDRLIDELLGRWDPAVLDRAVRASQAERRYLAPYLFPYLQRAGAS